MLPYYKETVPCDFCGEQTHGRIFEKDILCGNCKRAIIPDWESIREVKEPERYHEWILWKMKEDAEKGNTNETCADNPGTSRNRQDNDSAEDS